MSPKQPAIYSAGVAHLVKEYIVMQEVLNFNFASATNSPCNFLCLSLVCNNRITIVDNIARLLQVLL